MCGRLNIHDHDGIADFFEELGLSLAPDEFKASHNVAPGSRLWSGRAAAGALQLAPMEWGLIPPWARKGQFKSPLINARRETIREKPSFKNLIAARRIIIPVNGFYEWRRKDGKIPYYFHSATNRYLALAAIYQEGHQGPSQCCLITTAAGPSMADVHHRVPLILPRSGYSDWLLNDDKKVIDVLLDNNDDDQLDKVRVSDYVNNARNDGQRCIQPALAE